MSGQLMLAAPGSAAVRVSLDGYVMVPEALVLERSRPYERPRWMLVRMPHGERLFQRRPDGLWDLVDETKRNGRPLKFEALTPGEWAEEVGLLCVS